MAATEPPRARAHDRDRARRPLRSRAVEAPRLAALLLVSLGALATGCADPERLAQPPDVDRAVFEAEVYPILLRDCGFPACHGDPDRFFRVHGPGRTRLDASSLPYDAATEAEITATYDRARSMLAAVPDPRQSLLLRKPLEPSAGGGAHRGLDALGRNVYASTEDPSWLTLARWAGADVPAPALDAAMTDAPADPEDATATDAPSRDAGARDAGEDAP